MSETLESTNPCIEVSFYNQEGTVAITESFDLDGDIDASDIQSEIDDIALTIENCKEWKITKHINFDLIDRVPTSLDEIVDIAKGVIEHGEAFALYYNNTGNCSLEDFQEAYSGVHDSEEDFTETFFEDITDMKAIEKAGLNPYYIDYEKMANDWFINDFWSDTCSDGGVHVYRYL